MRFISLFVCAIFVVSCSNKHVHPSNPIDAYNYYYNVDNSCMDRYTFSSGKFCEISKEIIDKEKEKIVNKLLTDNVTRTLLINALQIDCEHQIAPQCIAIDMQIKKIYKGQIEISSRELQSTFNLEYTEKQMEQQAKKILKNAEDKDKKSVYKGDK